MTYKQKLTKCPYRTSNGNCVHKFKFSKRYKKNRICPYNNEETCGAYQEWQKLNKSNSELPSPYSDDFYDKGEL